MARPTATPSAAAGTNPFTSEARLDAAARESVPSPRSPHHATATRETGGTNIDTSSRPITSQAISKPAHPVS